MSTSFQDILHDGQCGEGINTPLHRLAAVDDHDAADDEAGRIRTQPHNRRGDLLGRPHSSDQFLRNHRLPSLSGPTTEAIHHRRIDDPGTHSVDADV